MEQDLVSVIYFLSMLCLLMAVINYNTFHRLSKLESSMKLLLIRQAEAFFDMRTTLNVQNAVHESLLGNPLSDPPAVEPQSPMDLALTHLRRVRDTLSYARSMHVLAGHYGDNILHALGADPSKSYSTKEVVEFIAALDHRPTIPEFLPMRGAMVAEPQGRPNPSYQFDGYSVGGNGAGYGSAGDVPGAPSARIVPAVHARSESTGLHRK